MGFPGTQTKKESAYSAVGSIPGPGRSPGEENGNPLQYSCLENPHGQRSLAGYCPWGRKELNTTGRLTTTQKGCSNSPPAGIVQAHLLPAALGTVSPKSLLIWWRYRHLTVISICIFLMISDTEHLTCLAAQNSDGLAGVPSREQRTRLPATQRKSSTPWWGQRRSKPQIETDSHPFAKCKEDTYVCVCVCMCVSDSTSQWSGSASYLNHPPRR